MDHVDSRDKWAGLKEVVAGDGLVKINLTIFAN